MNSFSVILRVIRQRPNKNRGNYGEAFKNQFHSRGRAGFNHCFYSVVSRMLLSTIAHGAEPHLILGMLVPTALCQMMKMLPSPRLSPSTGLCGPLCYPPVGGFMWGLRNKCLTDGIWTLYYYYFIIHFRMLRFGVTVAQGLESWWSSVNVSRFWTPYCCQCYVTCIQICVSGKSYWFSRRIV